MSQVKPLIRRNGMLEVVSLQQLGSDYGSGYQKFVVSDPTISVMFCRVEAGPATGWLPG
jgi:hypothetical protein